MYSHVGNYRFVVRRGGTRNPKSFPAENPYVSCHRARYIFTGNHIRAGVCGKNYRARRRFFERDKTGPERRDVTFSHAFEPVHVLKRSRTGYGPARNQTALNDNTAAESSAGERARTCAIGASAAPHPAIYRFRNAATPANLLDNKSLINRKTAREIRLVLSFPFSPPSPPTHTHTTFAGSFRRRHFTTAINTEKLCLITIYASPLLHVTK